jgi:hypothetical protein
MTRRMFVERMATAATTLLIPSTGMAEAQTATSAGHGREGDAPGDWLERWQRSILNDAKNRYCDKETGEELGWMVSPFLNGFYYGFTATRDSKWLEHLVDWTDSCLKRAIKEPDGFYGWPKGDGGGGESTEFEADSLLGEAMLLRPVVLAAHEIQKDPGLKTRWRGKTKSYVEFAEHIFEKWDSRDCWRQANGGGLWVVPAFGIDRHTGKWSAGYDSRKSSGFSNPDNKENHIARWLLAMWDATGKEIYRDRGSQWFALMKSRMKLCRNDTGYVWDYWDPAGPWDYKPDGSPKHWVGVHPNGGYYGIDVEAIVSAFEHKIVFNRADIDRLIATNRDFMWNQKVSGAQFQRIDGGQPDPRWKDSPGVLWTSLIPYDTTLKRIFLANHNPESWGGLATTPWYLSQARD